MKKIIKGKVYDTNTARYIGGWSKNCPRSDYDFYTEALYQKRTGEYFLYGEGGASSKYAANTGDGYGWGEDIRPVTYEAAQQWAEKRLDPDAYVSAFGDPDCDDSEVSLTVLLPAALSAKLNRTSEQRGISKKALIVELLEKM